MCVCVRACEREIERVGERERYIESGRKRERERRGEEIEREKDSRRNEREVEAERVSM